MIKFILTPIARSARTRITLYFFIIVGIFGCVHKVDQVTIDGTFEAYPKTKVFISRFDGNNLANIDSTEANRKGHFNFTLNCSSPYIVSIGINKNDTPITLILEPEQRIRIFSSSLDISEYQVLGSEGSMILNKLASNLRHKRYQIDSLKHVFQTWKDKPKADSVFTLIDSSFNVIVNQYKTYSSTLIKNNPYSLASIFALFQSLDSLHPVFSYIDDRDLFLQVDKSLISVYSSNSLVQNYHRKLVRLDSLFTIKEKRSLMFKEGSVLPDIPFSLISGESFYFTTIWYRYMLIDFWTYHHILCKENTLKIKEINKEFGPKGLVILQVCTDLNADSLKSVVASDSLFWYHAMEVNLTKSKLIDTLKITSVPANYLIDRRGTVKAVNLTPEALKLKLGELLR